MALLVFVTHLFSEKDDWGNEKMISENTLVTLVNSVATSIPENGSRTDTLLYSNGVRVVINSEYDSMGPYPPEPLKQSEYGLAPQLPDCSRNTYVLTPVMEVQPGNIVFALEEFEVSGWTDRGGYDVTIPKGVGLQVKQCYGVHSKESGAPESTVTVLGLDNLYIPVSRLGVEVAHDMAVN